MPKGSCQSTVKCIETKKQKCLRLCKQAWFAPFCPYLFSKIGWSRMTEPFAKCLELPSIWKFPNTTDKVGHYWFPPSPPAAVWLCLRTIILGLSHDLRFASGVASVSISFPPPLFGLATNSTIALATISGQTFSLMWSNRSSSTPGGCTVHCTQRIKSQAGKGPRRPARTQISMYKEDTFYGKENSNN